MPCGCFGKKKKEKIKAKSGNEEEEHKKSYSLKNDASPPTKASPEGETLLKRENEVTSDLGEDCALITYRTTESGPPSSTYADNSHAHTPSTVPAAASSAPSPTSSAVSSATGGGWGASCRAELEEKRREFFSELYPPQERGYLPPQQASTLPTAARARQFGKVRTMRPTSQPASPPDASPPTAPPLPPGPHLLRHTTAEREAPAENGFASPEFLNELRNASDEISRRWAMSDEERDATPSTLKAKAISQRTSSPTLPHSALTAENPEHVDVFIIPPTPPAFVESVHGTPLQPSAVECDLPEDPPPYSVIEDTGGESHQPFIIESTHGESHEPFIIESTHGESHQPFIIEGTHEESHQPFIIDSTHGESHEPFIIEGTHGESHEPFIIESTHEEFHQPFVIESAQGAPTQPTFEEYGDRAPSQPTVMGDVSGTPSQPLESHSHYEDEGTHEGSSSSPENVNPAWGGRADYYYGLPDEGLEEDEDTDDSPSRGDAPRDDHNSYDLSNESPQPGFEMGEGAPLISPQEGDSEEEENGSDPPSDLQGEGDSAPVVSEPDSSGPSGPSSADSSRPPSYSSSSTKSPDAREEGSPEAEHLRRGGSPTPVIRPRDKSSASSHSDSD